MLAHAGPLPMQQPISANGETFYGINGQPMALMGVNWFGFETSATAVAGLWQVRSLSGTPLPWAHGLRLCLC